MNIFSPHLVPAPPRQCPLATHPSPSSSSGASPNTLLNPSTHGLRAARQPQRCTAKTWLQPPPPRLRSPPVQVTNGRTQSPQPAERSTEARGPRASTRKDLPPDAVGASASAAEAPGHGPPSPPAPSHRQKPTGATPPVYVGQELELDCARLALEGKGVCLLPPTGFVVLVERALPGERVRVEVVAVRRGYAEARKLASLAPHRHAVPPPCPYFGPCGGCTLQSLQYEAQLAEKRNQVEQTLRRVGRLGPSLDLLAATAAAGSPHGHGAINSAVSSNSSSNSSRNVAGSSGNGSGGDAAAGSGVAETVGCRQPLAYRNKMMFHFSCRCWLPPDRVVDRPALGFLRPGTADVVLPVVGHGCLLQGATANAMLRRIAGLVSEHGFLPYNDRSGKGFLKHLVIRRGSGMPAARTATRESPQGATTAAQPFLGAASLKEQEGQEQEEFMVVFGVTHGPGSELLKPLAEALGREFPQLASVVAQQVAPPQPTPRGGGAAAGAGAGAASGQRYGGRDRRGRGGRGPGAGREGQGGSSASGGRGKRLERPGTPLSSSAASATTPAVGALASVDAGGDTLTGFADGADGEEASGAVALLYGRSYIHDKLCGLTFRISPGSFFQTNSRQAEVLYEIVRQAAGLRPGAVDTVLDLYCGTGTIGLSLAAECRTVIGVEVVESAVADARRNAATNAVQNALFARADVDELPRLDELLRQQQQEQEQQQGQRQQPPQHQRQPGGSVGDLPGAAGASPSPPPPPPSPSSSPGVPRRVTPDVVMVDPARSGISPGVTAYLSRCGARRVVYVSCNVATQARDLDRLCNGPDAAFRLVSVTPVDMFPHTDHVETVAVLDRRQDG